MNIAPHALPLPEDPSNGRSRVVIVGAGFGGLRAAKELGAAPVNIVLIDRHNYHTFQPLLYQVATAGLEAEEVAHAVRNIFHRRKNVRFRMGTVVGADWVRKDVLLANGDRVHFDYLVLAAGAATNFFGIDGAEEHSFTIKSLSEAVNLRSHILRQFEWADRHPDSIADGRLNFVVVGGGPTGVEMAGALVEFFDLVLKRDFPGLPFEGVRVILIELLPHLLPPFDARLREDALRTLSKRGVDVRLGTEVTSITPFEVRLKGEETIATRTLIWAAGVVANPLAGGLGLEQTRGGRIIVEDDLSVTGHPDVFVIGDMAGSRDGSGELHPQLAPVATQGGRHVAEQISRRIVGDETTPFRYRDYGIMATIGRNKAVAELSPKIKMSGFVAWVMWLVLHLIKLVGFRNRMNVLVNWAWNYFTYDRGARLILDVSSGSPERDAPCSTEEGLIPAGMAPEPEPDLYDKS